MPIMCQRYKNNRWKQNAKTKTKKNTTKNKKNNKGDGSYSERVREKWFFCCQEKLKIRYITCSSVIQKLDLVSFGDH